MKAKRISDCFCHCTMGKIYDVELDPENEGTVIYIDDTGMSMNSNFINWEILNKENLKENNMEKWNFTVRDLSEINNDLLRDCLTPKNPMLIVKMKEEKDFVIILIHTSIQEKSYKCKKGKKLRNIIENTFSTHSDTQMIATECIEEVKQAVIAIKNAPYKKIYKKLSCEVSLLDI